MIWKRCEGILYRMVFRCVCRPLLIILAAPLSRPSLHLSLLACLYVWYAHAHRMESIVRESWYETSKMVIAQEWNGIHFVLCLYYCALFLFKKLFDKLSL